MERLFQILMMPWDHGYFSNPHMHSGAEIFSVFIWIMGGSLIMSFFLALIVSGLEQDTRRAHNLGLEERISKAWAISLGGLALLQAGFVLYLTALRGLSVSGWEALVTTSPFLVTSAVLGLVSLFKIRTNGRTYLP